MQLQITKYQFDELFSALALNKIDIAASAITVAPKRKQTMDFTIPYFETDLAVVAKSNSPVKVEKIEDSENTSWAAKATLPAINI